MQGDIAIDIFIHASGWHCCRCVLLAGDKHNLFNVTVDHFDSIVPVDERTMHSLLWLWSSDHLKLCCPWTEKVSNMLHGACQIAHIAEV